jgi:ubiquinone/menaquinone biosynthesis C-methylase UbiE
MYGDYVKSLGLTGRERVLDFGSGSGNPAVFLAPILEKGGGELVCMDVSAKWQDVCRRRLQGHKNIAFKLGEIGALNFEAASFDVVFSHFALHELPAAEQPAAIRHFARILRPGGKVFLREPAQFMDPTAIRPLFAVAGLTEVSSRLTRIRSQGEVWEAVFAKG